MDLWQASLNVLAEALASLSWQSEKATVVLSGHFVRYAVMPWNPELGNRLERMAFLRHTFTLAYGEAAKQWDLRLSSAGYGNPALASATSPTLIDAIRHVLRTAGIPLQAIEPGLVPATTALEDQKNRRKKPYKPSTYCLVTLEQGRLGLGLVESGIWRSMHTLAYQGDWQAPLLARLRRESILHDRAGESGLPVFLCVMEPENPRFTSLATMTSAAWPTQAFPLHVVHPLGARPVTRLPAAVPVEA